MKEFDIIVLGGGHAGIEAAISTANMNCSTALITMDKNAIGRMSCNPAIGGSAKGHLVHEIDALGGVMGLLADCTGIQFRVLNKSKGPAVWAGRCQSDRKLYSETALNQVELTNNLSVIETSVNEVVVESKQIIGVITSAGEEIKCKALVICSGTFLNGLMHTGLNKTEGGRFGESSSVGLTDSLVKHGFITGRLKTGTPPRLKKNSVDWKILEEQKGDYDPEPFSLQTQKKEFPFLPQVSCFITYTDKEVHRILVKGFDRSPMFTGLIQGVGPRYCPSIEDKIVRFSDKERHQIFLEPEGLDSDIIYVNGFSTSLPADIQQEALKRVKGLENAEMVRPGYAVEYNYFPPYQVDLTLETKLIKGLYFAGQINGTSGYEEAAAQGLVAGINAALKVQGRSEFTLKRSEAYIGVMIDDLVGKSTNEPYRMFTSRAEHRLILRQDNADRRLLKYGYEFGLIPKELYSEFCDREKLYFISKEILSKTKLSQNQLNNYAQLKSNTELNTTDTIANLIKRPEISLQSMINVLDQKEPEIFNSLIMNPKVLKLLEIEIKYEGYIKRQEELVIKTEKMENLIIPASFNYDKIKAISSEGREKLSKVKPRSVGQASRIAGVTPSDISVLLVYLRG